MIRRACASKLGQFATQIEKQHILQEILPIYRQLSQDEQDTIRVMCLKSLIPMAKFLSKEENQIHTLGTLLAAGEDKSWRVRHAFAKHFADFADSFGKEITDNNLIQTFITLLNDNEFEVKNAAINNINGCLNNLSTDKICNLLVPTLINSIGDANAQFKAGAAKALCEMASFIGKDLTNQKVCPTLFDLLKDDNPEVKLNVIQGLDRVAHIVGSDLLTPQMMTTLQGLTQDHQWRVKKAVFELIGSLAHIYDLNTYQRHLHDIFMNYLNKQTAAEVRNVGIEQSARLAKLFKEQWVCEVYIPPVTKMYAVARDEKKGYNYRMCCLKSLAAVMPYIGKDEITKFIIPTFVMATKDDIPNVKFCVARIIHEQREFIDANVFSNQLSGALKDMSVDSDKDVAHFANMALNGVK